MFRVRCRNYFEIRNFETTKFRDKNENVSQRKYEHRRFNREKQSERRVFESRTRKFVERAAREEEKKRGAGKGETRRTSRQQKYSDYIIPRYRGLFLFAVQKLYRISSA